MTDSDRQRFMDKVHINEFTGCWIWKAGLNENGYGTFYFQGRSNQLAHRVAWFLEHGEWPQHTLDHLCMRPTCVNPAHLEDVTQRVNWERSSSFNVRRDLSKCAAELHEWTPENVYTNPNTGLKMCRPCNNSSARKRYKATPIRKDPARCKSGKQAWTEENWIIKKNGSKQCRLCVREAARNRKKQ